MSLHRHALLLAGLAALSLAGRSRAEGLSVATTLVNSGYTVRIWQTEDGLPQDTVSAIAQTADGYLWVATYGGLARFDGVNFQAFDVSTTPELGDARIVSLHEDREGTLWIGHDSGRITCYRHGRFTPFSDPPVQADERVAAINSDGAGAVWFLRQSGTLDCADGRSIPAPHPATRPELLALVRSDEGDLYEAEDGEVARVAAGRLQPVDFGRSIHSGFAMGLGPARGGGVWVLRDWSVKRWGRRGWTADRGACPWGGDTSLSVALELHDGTLAVGTMEHGLYLFSPDGRTLRFDRSNGLPQNWVRSLCEDREGDIWIGAGTGGLVQIAPSAFSVLTPPDQWRGRTELSVTEARDGSLWIGTEGAGLYRYRAGEWTHYGEAEGLGHPFVWSVAQAPDGRIWAGTWGGGIYTLDGDRFVPLAGYDGTAGPVFALQFSPVDGSVWIGTGRGLLRWRDGRTEWSVREQPGASATIWTVAQDRAQGVWFGSSDGGLGRLTPAGPVRYHCGDGLPAEAVQCLLPADDGSLWIGTAGGGLGWWHDGRFSTFGTREGLPSNFICHIADDGSGYLWLSSRHGILRVAKTELMRCAAGSSPRVACQAFDRGDGLPTMEFSGGLQSAGCRTADGRIWFTSSKGVVAVDPAKVRTNPLPPPMALAGLRVDNRPVALAALPAGGLGIAPEHRRIDIAYTALSFSAPGKVLFKYQLEGFDRDWVEAGAKRTVSFSHLPAGAYRFRAIACNDSGIWNTRGVSLAFTVRPFFWQTWWFRGLSVLVVLTAVALSVRELTRRRMQRRIAHWEQRHAIERERARIAQDIHDDIGASLTRISMLSQSAPVDPARSPQTEEMLGRIYATTRDATRALDEIVWAVDPRHDSLDGLVGYMGKFAQDFLATAGLRCRLDLPVRLPTWPVTAEVRHHLFLAFKEALNNALKHARATEVRVALAIRPRTFELSVADDGSGFEPGANGAAAGHGLANLHHRLARIGGRCEIVSAAGAGTRVTFVIPIPDASRTRPAPPTAAPVA